MSPEIIRPRNPEKANPTPEKFGDVIPAIKSLDLSPNNSILIFMRYLRASGVSYEKIPTLIGANISPEFTQTKVDEARREFPTEWETLIHVLGMKRVPQSELFDTEVRELRQRKLSRTEISALLHRPYSAVHASIRRQAEKGDLKLHSISKNKLKTRDSKVRKLWREGKTVKEIAQAVGEEKSKVRASVARLLKRRSIRTRRNIETHKEKLRKYIRRFAKQNPGQPINFHQAAKDLGLSRNYPRRLYQQLQEEGVPLPPKLPPLISNKN